jgi:hypothetical protein
MALSLEADTAEALRHVAAQARGRRPLYPDPAGRAAAGRQLGSCCIRHRLRCLAWCVTEERLQIVLRGTPGAITLAVHELIGARLHQGHWLSTTVQRDVWLLEVVRHILLGPVRAGACRSVAEWPFSSGRESLGLRPAPAWLDLAELYALLGPADGRGPERLRRFIESG